MSELIQPTNGQQTEAGHQQRHVAAIRHGYYVRAPTGLALKSRRVRRMAVRVRAMLSWLQPSDEPAVRAWCELELVTSRLFAEVLAKTDPGTTDLYRRVKQLQLAYERELGMTPASRAELGLSVAQGASFAERLASGLAKKAAREETQEHQE